MSCLPLTLRTDAPREATCAVSPLAPEENLPAVLPLVRFPVPGPVLPAVMLTPDVLREETPGIF